MGKQTPPPAISELAAAFARYGARQVKAFVDEDYAETLAEDPRRAAGIDFLARTTPAVLVTFVMPKLGDHGFAVGEKHFSVAFPIENKKAFSKAATEIERAFWADTRKMGATGLQVMSMYFVAEPPPREAQLDDVMPVTRRVEAAANEKKYARERSPKISFDRKARRSEREIVREPVDVTVRRFADQPGVFLRHRQR